VTPVRPAERLLLGLGIDRPQDIDLEAIAYCAGAEVRYRPLDSCQARIVGYGERAIITVQQGVRVPRTRFSIGHELGHWEHHRGRSFVCRREDIGQFNGATRASPELVREREADGYAADLLMPGYLLRPWLQSRKRPTFELIEELAAEFRTSLTASALRLVDLSDHATMLVCHSQMGRAWFKRGSMVPERWFPQEELDRDSTAMDVVFGSESRTKPTIVGADAWFDRWGAGEFTLHEQTTQMWNGNGLTLLVLTDRRMLD